MNVTHVISRVENSGPNSVMMALSKAQVKLLDRVAVASLQPERDCPGLVQELRDEGVEVIGFSGKRAAIRGLRNRVAQMPGTIIHLHCLRSLFVASLAGVRPLVVTSHNIPHEDWPLTRGRLMGTILGQLHYILMARADKVAAINSRMAEFIAVRGGNVVRVFNPVAIPTELRLETRSKMLRFVTVGHLCARKNPLVILEALERLGERALGVEMVFVGDGPLRKSLEARARKLLCQVTFTGFVDDPSAWFREADIYVSAAVSEGMPIAVLEAFSNGLPALLSDIPGHDFPSAPKGALQYHDGSETGLARCLERSLFAAAPAQRRDIVGWARKTFSPDVIASNYNELYSFL